MAPNPIRYFATNRNMENLSRLVGELKKERAEQRELRLKLQRGGYYWTDMSEYLAYYLSEVELKEMPANALIEDANDAVFKKFLESPKIGRVVVCVHGFNVHLHAAHTWFRTLFETLKGREATQDKVVGDPSDPLMETAADGELTAFVGFSWPSNGSTLAYLSDQRDAQASASGFGNLVGRLRVMDKPISLLCHSMGNYAACHMLKSILTEYAPSHFTVEGLKACGVTGTATELKARSKELLALCERGVKSDDEEVTRPAHLVDRYVMIAPDVERRHVTKSKGMASRESDYQGLFYAGLQHLVGQVTNVYSRFDGALKISDLEKAPRKVISGVAGRLDDLTLGIFDFLERNPDYKWEKRLGAAPHPLNAPPNVSSLNATELAQRPIDHGDHVDNPAIALAIADKLGI